MRNNRRLPAAVALIAIALIGWFLPAPAGAAPQPAKPAIAIAAMADLTLVTGHKLRFTRTTDGKQSAIVMSAPDGDGNVIAFTDRAGDLHVIPRRALPHLQDGLLDGRLFNVTRLVGQGYTDRERPDIPLIVTGAQATSFGAASDVRPLTNSGAVALTVDKKSAAGFWNSVASWPTTRSAGPALAGGATKIWLDGKVTATLDQSVPLVGAPEAWAAGYDGTGVTAAVLDTGYDPAHPDLAGVVTGSRGFTGSDTVLDGDGHGTHVAATVAGRGAASGGARKGVAPGAGLLVGKVLDDNGSGQESWVMAGMEWAATSGADVVNLSLGGGPSDGADPMSQALNTLTATTGTLFVVAAGNSGPGSGTVDTPGAADAALTVANTDKSDQLHEGSSRGPRLGDHAVKPEIAAPGTDIVAARAAGTSAGTPVDEHYTALTGTSMATPHVAGAAAIIAQRHPDWGAAQIKSALVGNAHALTGGTVFDHGAGRLDVAAALAATVTAEQSTLSFGFRPWPDTDGDPIERQITYRNTGTEPVTLDLASSATRTDGGPLDDGVTAVTPAQVTIPAGGTASATVAVVPSLVEPGDLSGLLTATAGDVVVRTPWSYGEESEHYTLTIAATGKDGKPSAGWAMVWSERMGQYYYGVRLDGTGPQTLRLPRDEYMVIGGSTVYDASFRVLEETIGGDPQLDLTEDRTVTFDARAGSALRFATPRPSTPTQVQLGWTRWYEGGGGMDGWVRYGGNLPRLAITGSKPVRNGEFEFVAGGRLVAPHTPAARTPYLYDLLLPTDGRVPASGTYRVRDLARIDSTFAGVGVGGRKTVEVRTGFSPRTSTQVGGAGEVHVAGPRTDYVSAGGAIWQSMVRLPQPGDLDVPTMWDNYRTYQAGSRQPTRWWSAPYSVGTDSDYSITDAYRMGNELSVLLRDYQDGSPDHWGDSYWNDDELATVRSRFYRDGTLLKDVNRGSFDVSGLPAEVATYRLVHSITRRGPVWTSSTYSESDWTFRSGYESNPDWPPKGIPLLDVNWSVPTDTQNRAPDASWFPIGVHTRHVRDLPGGTIRPPRAWVSYDDGRHWWQVVLLPRHDNRYTGHVLHPPKRFTTGWVSLRVEVTDSSGGALKQTAIRAYALK